MSYKPVVCKPKRQKKKKKNIRPNSSGRNAKIYKYQEIKYCALLPAFCESIFRNMRKREFLKYKL